MIAGLFIASAILLGAGGLLKLGRPEPTTEALRAAGFLASHGLARTLAAAEIAIGIAAIAYGGTIAALLVAASYAGFAGFVAAALRRGDGVACGCFGRADSPPTKVHLIVNLGLTVVAVVAAAQSVPHLLDAMADQPAAGVPFLGYVLLLSALLYALLAVLPETQAARRRRPKVKQFSIDHATRTP